jgi:hypothetical protein
VVCAEAEILMSIWRDALDEYSEVVQDVCAAAGDDYAFKYVCETVERACLKVHSARYALHSHCADHGCVQSKLTLAECS